MSTQHNFNRFPFALADDLDSDLGHAFRPDLGEELDSLAYGRAWAGYV